MAITVDRDGAVCLVTLDRPERMNAFTAAMLGELIDLLGELGRDDGVDAVVLTGRGRAFSSGADVEGLREAFHGEGSTQSEGLAGFDPSLWLVDCPKPVVAAVNGVAVGMGAEIATQADVRIGSPAARFAWNFSRLGLVPDTGAASWLLPHIVGLPKALQLLYSGEFLEAEAALECGFLSAVAEPGELVERAIAEARRLGAGYGAATARVKRLVYGGLGREQAENLAATRAAVRECFASDDFREAVAAFLDRS